MSCLRYVVVGADFANVHHLAPLQNVSVSGILRDTVAEYTLVQTYVNPHDNATIEAAYTFPLYEGVAVSGFEAEVDGRKIVGKLQEKAAARKEYETAVKAGKVASLLEQEKPDVFQASVGNIPPAKAISIRITLISEIKQDADENEIRFVLPTTIAPRYGIAPEIASSQSSVTAKFSAEISCAMSKQITSVQSPSHTIQVHLGKSPTKVSLTSDSLLDRDLVLIVQALGLDAPRALVERHPRDGTHAVAFTFAPRFALNALKSSELIFLVDRSGSMRSGSQIRQAAEALELFLRSIPSDDHYINIIGFGSHHQALFPKSVEYSAESLRTTTKYAQDLRADMGGTELLSAFQEVFERRRRDVPTQIFLLTDGQIWNVEALTQCIKDAVDEGEKQSSLVRVFSLGVGSAVSHNLIEAVARAGGGYSQLVVEGERMEKKVVNMLKAALMPPVTNVGIQWTDAVDDASGEDDFEMVEAVEEEAADSQRVLAPEDTRKEPISLFSTLTEVPTPPAPPSPVLPDVVTRILQTPFRVPALYRGARFTIYAILSSETPVPKEIILRGSSADGPVELKVPVESVQEGETMLHSLAARTLLRDLEEGASCIHALRGSPTATTEQMLKKLGVHVLRGGKKWRNKLSEHDVSKLAKQKTLELALKYSLSSKYTSWVAVDTESDRSVFHKEAETEPQVFYQGGGRGLDDMAPARGLWGLAHSGTYLPVQAQQQSAIFGSRTPASGASPFSAVQAQPLSARFGTQVPAFGTSPFSAVQAQPQSASFGAQNPAFGASPFPSVQVQPQPANFGVQNPPVGASLFSAVEAQSQSPSFGAQNPFGGATPFPAVQAHTQSASFGAQLFSMEPANELSGFAAAASHSSRVSSKTKKSSIFLCSAPPPPVGTRPEILFKKAAVATDPHARLHALLLHQQFDGLFPLNEEIAALLSTTVEEMKTKLTEFRNSWTSLQLAETEWETLWATCLGVQFLRKQLPELMEEWELVVEKAERRVAAIVKSAEELAAMQQAASEMVKKDEA